MKAIILSGGTGSRLRPLTFTGPKQLLPVANKPILFYAIEAIRDAGIRDIGIIVGNTGDEIRSVVGDGSTWGVEITYLHQSEPKGLAHAVQVAEQFIGNDSFLMFLGDNIIKNGVKSFVEEFQTRNCNTLVLLSEVTEPERFGVAKFDGDRLIELVEKPKIPPSNLAVVGVYMFDPLIFNAIRYIRPSWRNELEITDAIQWLIDSGAEVEASTITDWWKDTGKPEDVLEANRILLETIERSIRGNVDESSAVDGRVIIEEGATMINSIVRGPALIGHHSNIVNSYVGPFTSINSNVHLLNSEIENSIVMENTAILNVSTRIDNSMIGKNVSIRATDLKPKSLNFVLGDQSNIVLR